MTDGRPDSPSIWAAEMINLAAQAESDAGLAGARYFSKVASELRASAMNPPACEEAFRYRLCVILEWCPRYNTRDLDSAVAAARSRKP